MQREHLAAACALLLAACAACGRAAGPDDPKDDRPTVTMTGNGMARRVPDSAMLRLRVDARAARPAAAQQRGAEIAAGLVTRLRALRIPDRNVQTVSYSLDRDYEEVKGRAVLRGYLVSQIFYVQIDEIPRVGEIIDAIEAAGPIAIEGPSFELRSAAAAQADALKEAVADARAKADAAVQSSGAHVVRVLKVEEQSVTVPERMSGLLSARSAPAAPQTTVAPGELVIEARVTLTAEIR